MKRLNTAFILALLLPMVASAHDIEAVNEDGVTIYYYFMNNNTELAVSYQGDAEFVYDDEYSGNVVIPESVTYNGTTYPVTSIIQSAFSDCTGLTSVTIPNSVTSIGGYAFYNTGIYTNAPDGVFYVDQWVCGYKGTMPPNTSISLEEGTRGISCNAFCYYSYITSIYIPNSVTSIGDIAFSYCSGLTSITIPNSVTSIGNGAFDGCSGLTSVTIGNSVTSIGYETFKGCSSLTSVTIPNSVTSIGQFAFYGCSGLTSVTIPNSVTSIGGSAFYYCSGLTSVTIPNSVTSIGGSAFSYCSGLTSVTIPNSVTSIGQSAFSDCPGLTSVIIGNSVTSIGERTFNNCSGLTDVYCYAENVPTASSYAFINSSYYTATLHVPAASIERYRKAWPWSGFGSIVALPAKCATPTIAFANGEFTFDCETEGVELHYALSLIGETAGIGNKIPAASSYRVSVYATKEGYADSDVATMDIDLMSLLGDANGDGEITIADAVGIVNIILGKNNAGDSQEENN